MFRRSAAIGFLIILLLSGCAETRLQTVDDATLQQQLALLEDGKTTKEDILLKFGIPSSQFEGERILTYRLRFNQKENRFEVISSRGGSERSPLQRNGYRPSTTWYSCLTKSTFCKSTAC